MSDRWEPFDSQHMASRGRAMMRGQRLLVGVTGVYLWSWMAAMERGDCMDHKLEGDRDPGQSTQTNRLSLSFSPSITHPALWLA